MKRMTLVAACLASLFVLPLAGCGASTKLTNVWTAPGFQENSLKKLMILAIAPKPSVRMTFEDTFAAALREKGVDAVPGYQVLGDGPIDSAMVVNAVTQGGFDGLFITRLVDKQMVETYYAPSTTVVAGPSPAYYGGWYGYYSVGYSYVSSPGYTVQNMVVNLETNLYRTADSKLVWSALSESWLEQTGSPGGEIKPFVTQLVYGLENSKVVGKVKK
jgi:hypothetical protein